MGFFGYLKYGSDIASTITLNMDLVSILTSFLNQDIKPLPGISRCPFFSFSRGNVTGCSTGRGSLGHVQHRHLLLLRSAGWIFDDMTWTDLTFFPPNIFDGVTWWDFKSLDFRPFHPVLRCHGHPGPQCHQTKRVLRKVLSLVSFSSLSLTKLSVDSITVSILYLSIQPQYLQIIWNV